MDDLSDAKILDSWQKNTTAWTHAVREQSIESRRLVTDAAIIEAVLAEPLVSVLDIGCGEGWLTRALSDEGLTVTGLDAMPEFIREASNSGPGRYLCMSYEELAERGLLQTFDAAVCNFSLLGHESVDALIRRIPTLLNPGGRLIVQTINPNLERGKDSYRDGWRSGSWDGFDEDFVDPAPWYFRTLESWRGLLADSGFQTIDIIEPPHPRTGRANSVIFIGRMA